MSSRTNPLAGKLAPPDLLVDVPKLVAAYYENGVDPSVPSQRVSFGTSGHRGSSFEHGFNEGHILAITQAICEYRRAKGIEGPLFLGSDTHALSFPAYATALEVLAANGVGVRIPDRDEFVPTPALSRAILAYNQDRTSGLADGIVVTPSHNPPDSGGFKYNPPNGGPAETGVTKWIETRANAILESGSKDVKRMPFEKALSASSTRRHDFREQYVNALSEVIDMEAIRDSGLRIGVDPLGGAGVHYWGAIAETYHIDLTVVNRAVDPTFRFMTVDWDGRIRMDPSSVFAMQGLIGLKDRFDIAFGCDTDHDRHGIVTRSAGLMPPNHYLSVMISYLFQNRPAWSVRASVGKTVVSSGLIDRVARKIGRLLYEVPVGFKWFVEGLLDGSLGFGGEESAGASFLKKDGRVWTTDKDGLAAALLSAEIAAKTGRDPGEAYQDLARELGDPAFDRLDAPATREQKARLSNLSADRIPSKDMAGEPIREVLTSAPGNQAPIGGVKVVTENGWFAARPSGTENLYKIYAESFKGEDHLRRILADAQAIVDRALAADS